MSKNLKSILFVVNTASFFLSHRLPIAVAAKNAGYDVHVASSVDCDISKIEAAGLTHHEISFKRSGQNIYSDMLSFISLIKLFRNIKPAIIHLVTIKPVIYGGIAARIVRVKSVVAAISGLGTVFIDSSYQGYLRRLLVLKLYRIALNHHSLAVIFQNIDDQNTFLKQKLLKEESVNIIRGSGVRLEDYPYLPEPNSTPVVVMASRLLKDKGVYEFIESAKILKNQGVEVIFRLIGESDPDNKTSVSEKFLQKCRSEGFVELLGYRRDIAEQYAKANIVCLPSYREGLPKSLIEAAACGRAVVTTNVAGCRDAITPNVTGVLCPVRDSYNLSILIKKLIDNPTKRLKMGRAGRELAKAEFTIEQIIKDHMNIYYKLLS